MKEKMESIEEFQVSKNVTFVLLFASNLDIVASLEHKNECNGDEYQVYVWSTISFSHALH